MRSISHGRCWGTKGQRGWIDDGPIVSLLACIGSGTQHRFDEGGRHGRTQRRKRSRSFDARVARLVRQLCSARGWQLWQRESPSWRVLRAGHFQEEQCGPVQGLFTARLPVSRLAP